VDGLHTICFDRFKNDLISVSLIPSIRGSNRFRIPSKKVKKINPSPYKPATYNEAGESKTGAMFNSPDNSPELCYLLI
jgi:hypothetical protein